MTALAPPIGTPTPDPSAGPVLPEIEVVGGPRLLAHLDDGPGLDAHRARFGPLAKLSLADLIAAAEGTSVRGRGGAGFPLAVKLAAAARGRRPLVVVNAAEGEPASGKDTALMALAPHRVLDGAVLAARALGTREVHVVTPSERPAAGEAVTVAVAERRAAGEKIRWTLHTADPGFVSGQARAVIELMSGRPNLPVTAWEPEAVSGYRRRPTLLSNAETFAQLGTLVRLGETGYAALGLAEEPGTVLLTVTRDGRRRVMEVPTGTPWSRILDADELSRPVLTGGYHGTWSAPGQLAGAMVGRGEMARLGLALGAGVVIAPRRGRCPVTLTASICAYLAASSARRCGPCLNGLPALSDAVTSLAEGRSADAAVARMLAVAATVERRGACAHPDGTARLVRSLLDHCDDEVRNHLEGRCLQTGPWVEP